MAAELNDNIIFREFRDDDRDRVAAFFAQIGGETRAFFDRGSGNTNFAMSFFDKRKPNTAYFMAELNGVMIGYVYLWDTHKSVPWLGIAVHEEYKGMHLGRRLISHAVAYVKEKGKGGILLTTHVANLRGQGLYERMNFERLGMHTSGEVLYLLRF